MNETMDTNDRIAELLREQTYEERMEMAASFRDMAIDAKTDDIELDLDWFAHAIQGWADAQLEPVA